MRIALALLSCLAVSLAAQAQEVRFEQGRFTVAGWTAPAPPPAAGWASVLRVYAGIGDVPPMLGRYTIENGTLVFDPRFAPGAGLPLRAVLDIPGARPREFSFTTAAPAATARAASVHRIYPTSPVLPENQLKLYIEFSSPMSQGEAWQHLRLLDERGATVDAPFLEIEQELWDPDGKRLTVLFDPGRIKRGLASLHDAGTSLEAGKRYTLVVDVHWRDSHGVSLKEPHRKEFSVVAADRTPPDPANWTVLPPPAGTREPLIVEFPEPLDRALLEHSIAVKDTAGRVTVGDGETEWRFTPESPWGSRDYVLRIDTRLEDRAGNRVGRPFDVDVFDAVTKRVERAEVELRFRPASPARQ